MSNLYTYVNYIPPLLLCPLCCNVYLKPVTLAGCKHTFCEDCFLSFNESLKNSTSIKPNKVLKKHASKLSIPFATPSTSLQVQPVNIKSVVSASTESKRDSISLLEKAISLKPVSRNNKKISKIRKIETSNRNSIHSIKLSKKCPSCKNESIEYFFDVEIENQLQNLKIKCLNCKQEIKRNQIDKHLNENCPEKMVKCVNDNCDAYISRKNSLEHLKNCNKLEHHVSDSSSSSYLTNKTQSCFNPENNICEFEQGVLVEYFEGNFDSCPNFEDLNPDKIVIAKNLNINSKNITHIIPGISVTEKSFAVRFSYFIDIEQEGKYTFYISSNDGSKLYIDDMFDPIIDNDGIHYCIEKGFTSQISEGRHEAKIEYFYRTGKLRQDSEGPKLLLSYHCPGSFWYINPIIPKKEIDPEILFYKKKDFNKLKLIAESQSTFSMKSTSIRKNSSAMQQLNIQLEVANNTINYLEQMLQQTSQQQKQEIDSLSAQLENETMKRHNMVEKLSDLYISSNTRVIKKATNTLDIKENLKFFNTEEFVENVKKLQKEYFFSAALSTKVST